MAEPPFPVPIGMEWDPKKKRFFKAAPKGGPSSQQKSQSRTKKRKARQKEESSSSKGGRATSTEQLSPELKTPTVVTHPRFSSFGHNHANAWQSLRSTAPRMVDVHATQQALVIQQLGQLRHLRTATADMPHGPSPFFNRRLVGIHDLNGNDRFGSILFFMSWNGFVYSIDTSQMHSTGTTEVALHLAELSWHAPQRPYQDRIPLSPTTLSFRATMADRLLVYAPSETPDCYGLDDDCFAFFASPLELKVYRLSTSASNEQSGRCINVMPDKYHVKILRNWPTGGYITLSMRRLRAQGCLIICVGVGNRICLYRLAVTEDQDGPFGMNYIPSQSKVFRRADSDVMSHDISADGSHVIVGCRNGRVARLPLLFEDGSNDLANKSSRIVESDYLPLRGVGAVTNVKHMSDDEVLLAYSSGNLVSCLLHKPNQAHMVFEGHINSWTLNPPMTIDLRYKVFALAGQDRRVRIWSFDHAQPLGYDSGSIQEEQNKMVIEDDDVDDEMNTFDPHRDSTSTQQKLSQVVFANQVTGLTFCQRFAVSNDEAMQNSTFLPRGVPALAISCGGSEITFFE
ncbi:uncharacterized protein FA14DRAFT_160891 [Meira miltonrushii]|uniref:WD40 repeat-like protein n=1 Tax=Meira miltonrushii TaxID=1280837 RepID=A0A316VFU1_9BASI|nr:uncharacterized protein FA14DRAFT_160891 [Meira miltonrushii]PWN35938.1 hypothetical protein FA14DRAFT_160891 [Meira miltonrushii]